MTTDEPTASDPGSGGEVHAPDAEISNEGGVILRAERSGDGDGRVYHITVTATDSSNNSVSASVPVEVRHNEKTQALDSGQNYDATEIN